MQLLQSYHFLSLLLLKCRLHLLWLSGKESAYKQEIKETRVEALVWEDPLEEEMAILSSPVFLPGKSHGQNNLAGEVHGVTQS